MTKPQSSEGYRGPWLKFARTKPGETPILSYTKNGRSWKRLSPDVSWDIIAMLRGPDNIRSDPGGISSIKHYTTGRVRGMFHSWGKMAWSMHDICIGRGCGMVVCPPRTLKEYSSHANLHLKEPNVGGDEWHTLQAAVGRHFAKHYRSVLLTVHCLWGDWPLKEQEEVEEKQDG